jgi:microcystin-dependent protein
VVKLDIQYDILNNAPATASPVEANFNRIEQYVNQELIERTGTVAMTGPLQLYGNPETPLAAAPKQYVDAILPIGLIMMYGGVSAPAGGKWAVCSGTEMESALYPELFAVISTTYSPEGTPAGRFHLPNLLDRFAIGAGTIATIGKTGGQRDTELVLPAHSHAIDHQHADGSSGWDSPDHNHGVPDHLHTLNNWTGGQSVDHSHNIAVRNDPVSGSAGSIGRSNAGGTIVNIATAGTSIDHAHLLSGTTGASDRNLTSGGASARHVHVTPTPAFAGRSGTEGVATPPATNANLPPYVGITYIIRVK